MKKNVGAPTCVVGQKIFTCRILCLPLQIHQSELSKLHVEAMRSLTMVSVRPYEASCHMGMPIKIGKFCRRDGKQVACNATPDKQTTEIENFFVGKITNLGAKYGIRHTFGGRMVNFRL